MRKSKAFVAGVRKRRRYLLGEWIVSLAIHRSSIRTKSFGRLSLRSSRLSTSFLLGVASIRPTSRGRFCGEQASNDERVLAPLHLKIISTDFIRTTTNPWYSESHCISSN